MPGRKSPPDTFRRSSAFAVAALAAPFYALVRWQLERRRGPVIGRYRCLVGPRELHLEPGLVYVTE